ncbi:hypothetical protein ACFYTV_23200 [Streptomyces sp. NPDC004562]|uniref:hypothetical protein n=1 Tax=Streptomyces sp. NPDC004562 TaxID=3364703 RepID=UPI0036A34F67
MGEIGDERVVVHAGEKTLCDGALESQGGVRGDAVAQSPSVAFMSKADGLCRRGCERHERRLRCDGTQLCLVEVGAERGAEGLPLVEAHMMPFREGQSGQGGVLARWDRVGGPPGGVRPRREEDAVRTPAQVVYLTVDFDDELDPGIPGFQAERVDDATDGCVFGLCRVPCCPGPLRVRQDHDVTEVLVFCSQIQSEKGSVVLIGDTYAAHHAICYLLSGTACGIDEHGTGCRIGELSQQLALSSARRAIQVQETLRGREAVQSCAELIDRFP